MYYCIPKWPRSECEILPLWAKSNPQQTKHIPSIRLIVIYIQSLLHKPAIGTVSLKDTDRVFHYMQHMWANAWHDYTLAGCVVNCATLAIQLPHITALMLFVHTLQAQCASSLCTLLLVLDDMYSTLTFHYWQRFESLGNWIQVINLCCAFQMLYH